MQLQTKRGLATFLMNADWVLSGLPVASSQKCYQNVFENDSLVLSL